MGKRTREGFGRKENCKAVFSSKGRSGLSASCESCVADFRFPHGSPEFLHSLYGEANQDRILSVPVTRVFPSFLYFVILEGFFPSLVIFLAGGYCTEAPPVSIPNTAVKLSCAEDTWREAAWENRALPALERIVTSSPLFFPLYIPQ